MQAINHSSEEKAKVWLTYWIVFGFFTAFDKLLSFVLFFLPGYYFLKCCFYIWMFYPRTNGAQIIYQNLLKPQLLKFKEMTDKKFDWWITQWCYLNYINQHYFQLIALSFIESIVSSAFTTYLSLPFSSNFNSYFLLRAVFTVPYLAED